MAYKDLQHFIKVLKDHDELIEINEEVDAILEITQIANKIMKSKGQNKALLFNHVKRSEYPVLINAFGSHKRMALALEVDELSDIAKDIKSFMDLSNYKGLKKQVMALPRLSRLYFSFCHKALKAPCQEVVEEPNLDQIPILKCWPEDGERFFTLPLVITKDPETGQQNMGMYRMQVYDKKTTGMHWHWHKDGREIYDKYLKKGITKMPISVVVGADPATVYAATAPLPKMIDELMFASFLRKRSLGLVKSKTNEIMVPANAEFVFEGYVDITEDYRLEGPFGDHTGYYSLPDMYPVFHIEKVTRKKKPVFHATIVGIPPMEDCYMAKATEDIFLPLMQMTLPELKKLHMPFEGVFHNLALATIEKKYPKHAFKMINSFWGTGQMMYQKMVVVFDQEVDIYNYPALFERLVKNIDLKHDLLINEGPLDALDHSSKKPFYGGRLGIDCTTRLEAEKIDSKSYQFKFDHQSLDCVTSLMNYKMINYDNLDYGMVVQFNKEDETTTQQVISQLKSINLPKLVFLFDQSVDLNLNWMLFWRLFNNIDSQRDLYFVEDSLIVDATLKTPNENGGRDWPNDIIMDQEIVDLVERKWTSYGFKNID